MNKTTSIEELYKLIKRKPLVSVLDKSTLDTERLVHRIIDTNVSIRYFDGQIRFDRRAFVKRNWLRLR